MTSQKSPQTMKPATAAKKLGVYLEATPPEFQEGVVSRDELDALQADPPEWLRDLRREGPHPRPVVAAKLGTRWVISLTVITRSFDSVSGDIAVTAIGVFCSGVSRLVAVTFTVSSDVASRFGLDASEELAPSSAAKAVAVASTAAIALESAR